MANERFSEKSIEEFVRGLIAEEKVKKDFLGTQEFREQIGLIKKFPIIDQEDIKYFPEKYSPQGLTPESFQRVCESVFLNFEKSLVKEIPKGRYSVDYKGVRFTLVLGQGSCYLTNRI